jgi:ankyrin repeat protein
MRRLTQPLASQAAGDTLLHLAAGGGDVHVVRMLFEYGSILPELRNKARKHAASGAAGSELVLEARGRLMRVSYCRSQVGSTALHLAALGNHVAVMRLLIARGVSIHAIDKVRPGRLVREREPSCMC